MSMCLSAYHHVLAFPTKNTSFYLILLQQLPHFLLLLFIYFLERLYLFIIREKGNERQRERNINVRNIDQLPLLCTWMGDWTQNLGMCPDRESNRPPFTLWDDAQPTEPYQSGHFSASFNTKMSEKSHPHLLIVLIDLINNLFLLLDHFCQHTTIHSSYYSSLTFVKVTDDSSLSSQQHLVWLVTSSSHLGSLCLIWLSLDSRAVLSQSP